MRDRNRIPVVLDDVGKIWRRHADWRLGQLVSNLATWADPAAPSVWDVEDEPLRRVIQSRLPSSRAQSLLDEFVRSQIGQKSSPSSCTFYVRDPWWPDEYRLVCMSGVHFKEPMYGFMFPPGSKRLICDTTGSPETYFDYGVGGNSPYEESEAPPKDKWLQRMNSIRRELANRNELFGSFAEREGLLSCARLQQRDKHGVLATLFVNFDDRVEFDENEELKTRARNLLQTLVELLPAVHEELTGANPFSLAQLIRILRPAHMLETFGFETVADPRKELKCCLKAILDATFEALDLREDSDLGTIHSLNEETDTLELREDKGKLDRRKEAEAQSVIDGDGVITWVALKQQSILITDLAKSPFRQIHKHILDGVQSELAVPMVAGRRVLGVLNFDSTRKGAFSQETVRLIWYAAEQAANALRLYAELSEKRKEATLNSKLLSLSDKAAVAPVRDQAVQDELAHLMCSTLEADQGHIWEYLATEERFAAIGSTDPDAKTDALPRTGQVKGWSEYVRRTRRPVCLGNIKSETNFDAVFWNPVELVWEHEAPDPNTPSTVHPLIRAMKIHCEFGLPILVGDECIGVAWLKYEKHQAVLSSSFGSTATGLVGEAALVLYKFRKHEEGEGVIPVPRLQIVSWGEDLTERAPTLLRLSGWL